MSTARKGQPERVLTKEEQHMDAQELVQQLVRGSANINRMREEINSIVSIVISIVHGSHLFYGYSHQPLNFCGSDYRWEARGGGPPDDYLEVRCWLESLGLVYSSVAGETAFSMKYVMRVHQALPVFVDGMSQAVPGLAKKWQPLLAAAAAEM